MNRYISNTNTIYAILTLLFCGLYHESAAQKSYVETIERSFDFSVSNPRISVTNKYGNVKVQTTKESKAFFTIEIEGKTSSEAKFKEQLQRVNIDFTPTNGSVDALLSISQDKGVLFGSNMGLKFNWTIIIPENSQLKISNSYGDVFTTNLGNDLTLNLRYGNGLIQNIDGDLNISLGYVKKFTAEAVKGNITSKMSYSNMDIISGKNLKLESKYSNFNIDRCGDASINSNYDKVSIQNVDQLYGELRYSTLKIGKASIIKVNSRYTTNIVGEVLKDADFDSGYGSIKIDEIADSFTSVRINSKYTEVNLGAPQHFHLDLQISRTGFNAPDKLGIRSGAGSSTEIKKTIGNNPSGRIKIDMNYGRLNMK